jgi:ribosomal protein S18 acetylase RimI-like enzyme
VQVLKSWKQMQQQAADIMIIPARAAIEQYAELCRCWTTEDHQNESLARAMLLHLDDPKYDALIAIDNTGPIGMAGLQSRGDAGRLQDIYVQQKYRGRGIGSMLLGRVIELAARAQLKTIFVMTSPANHAARRLYERIGFQTLGSYVVYLSPDLSPEATVA